MLVLLSACGGSPYSSSTGSGGAASSAPSAPAMPGMSTPASPPATTAPATGNTVTIQNFAFAPASLKVKAGTTVTWTNKDTDAHTVTSKQGSGGPLNSAPLTTGATYRYTFTKAGTYAYYCSIHPFMTATVVVTP
ncbi:cupredoxin domain-containing protein [Kitasatospora aureofaciens]|uniref:cupredoxin domain-containing protein n=1 Tax=Kitasatospora aureofaciens TaxID=1894 RepID=UPI0036F462FA